MSGGARDTYDASLAAFYWSGARHDSGDELAAVLSLGEPPHVNAAYDAWETGVLLDAVGTGGRGLDLGAGVGRVSLRLAARVERLVGADLAMGMLERLRANAERAGVPLEPVRLRSDRLPFPNGAFSVAVCLGLLEHLPEESRRNTLAELARVLRPGGRLGIVLNNDRSALLRDPSDNPHRVGAQRENGYYCAVVHEKGVLADLASDFEERPLGSNLFYSLQRHASRALGARRRDARLSTFFDRAAAWDRALRPRGPLADAAADHHLHLLIRR